MMRVEIGKTYGIGTLEALFSSSVFSKKWVQTKLMKAHIHWPQNYNDLVT